MLAKRTPIDLQKSSEVVLDELSLTWAEIIAECEEGLVLKAEEGFYNDWRSPWVKVPLRISLGNFY